MYWETVPILVAAVIVLSILVVTTLYKVLQKLASKIGTIWVAGSLTALVMIVAGVYYGTHIK